ncbi:hypothetical protein [Streptomyces sp. NPDC008150]|uniref:hypothetical protein n=1 Tax=Streptomyces sp. NPDC008150 TaxID=3364816 RepID=UPI0036E2CE7F
MAAYAAHPSTTTAARPAAPAAAQRPVPDDLVTFAEAVALLQPTGHPVADTTLRRWIREAGSHVYGSRVSWTDVVRVHRDRTAVKLRASAAW